MNAKISLKKRIVSVILTVIMVFSMVPLSVFAANGGEAEVTLANGSPVNFNVYSQAVAYANANDGSTLKLLDDITVPEFENLDDIPFVTGEFTLDLNGKSINYVNVGSYDYDEEADEEIKGTPGTLTVTDSVGNGNIEYLAVNAGALTVAGGAVNYMYAENYAAAVNVTGGTVENFSLSDGKDEEVSATVSGGVVRWLYMNGGTLTVNGGEYPEKINMDLGGGTTNIVGGTFADLGLKISHGEIRLTGGTFTKISTELKVGSSEYREPTLASLLGDGCAFYGTDGSGIVNADVLTLENVKIIADHKHSYGSGGKCTGCGAPCPHGNVVDATGECKDCGTQLEAKVTYTGKAPVFFTSFREAVDSVFHNQKAQVTVTLLYPKYDLGMNPLYLENNNNIKLDLNGHTMSGSDSIVVEGNSALTVANGKLDSKLTIEAAGGDVTVEKDCEGVGTIKVTDAESTVTVFGGDIGKLSLPYTDTESLKNIKLSGGYFNSVSFSGGDTVAITDMLEAGYAFKDNKGILKTTPGGLVPYGLTVSAKTYFAELEVVKCEHSAVNEVKGYCNYCGKLYAGKITDKNGAVRYVEELLNDDFADGNTVMLLQDIDNIVPKNSCTIEVGGRSVKMVSFIAQGETLTLKGYGKIGLVIIGYNDTDSTLVIEDTDYRNRVKIGTLSVNKTTKTKLTGGQFDKIERKDGRFVEELLADGYSFFDADWEDPIYISGKTSLDKPYFIYNHDHWFELNEIEGHIECKCGLICHHTEIGADGKCRDYCKRQIYTATLTKADGTVTNYEAFADAWTAAAENEGSTLKLLCDLDLGSGDGSSVLKVSNGKFTLDLGNRTLEGTAQNTVIQVSGTADIKIINGKIGNKFDGSGSSLSPTDANAVRAESGAEVTLDGVEFTAGSNENTRGSAVYVIDGKLTVTDSKFYGLVMLLKRTSDVSVKLASSELLSGIAYGYTGTKCEYESVSSFFADGNMLFDADGKYIDTSDGSLWEWDDVGAYKAFTFSFSESCSVKPHTHTYSDGVCSECDYACPHNSGKNEREASYFQKAICSVCHAEYGDCAKDTTAPTGEIKVKERTWWRSLLNKISFGLFFKENVSMTITANDDSYSQPGFDKTKHAVKIEYLISNTAMSEEAVKASTFTEYSGAIDLSDEEQYVIYAKLTDHAENVAYASTDGFEIDKTAPTIDGMKNGGVYYFCGGKTITVTEKNIDKVTMDGNEISLDENGQFTIPADSEKHEIIVTDKAENETTVYITVYPSHDFDKTTDTCLNCGTLAAAKVEKGEISDLFATGDELFSALEDEKYDGATVTLLKDAEYTERVSLKHDLTIEMNGKSLRTSGRSGFGISSGEVTIRSSVGTADIGAMFGVNSNAHLVMGEGIGKVETIVVMGKLTVYSGSYDHVYTIIPKTKSDDITLYGGTYGKLELTVLGARDVLAKGYRFRDLLYADAGDKILNNVTVIPCDHANVSNNICNGCGMEIFLSVEANGETKLFGTFEDAIRYAEANTGCTVKLLQDLTLDDATVGSLKSGYRIYLEKGKYTIDLNGKTLDIINGNQVVVREDCDLTIGDSDGGGKVISSSGGGDVQVGYYTNNNAKLTVTGGEFNVNVTSYNQSALVLKGGSFKKYVNSANRASCSPFVYLSDGYTFELMDSASGNNYANEGNVEVDHDGSQMIRNVTVVPAPLVFRGQPTDVIFYLTSPEAKKCVDYLVSYVGDDTDKKVTLTPEKADGSKISTVEVPAVDEIAASFDMAAFGVEHSGQYRIRAEFSGYVLYSNTFTVTVAECEHPGYDRSTNKCTQCGCDLAAAIDKSGKTTGYVSFADALAAAQTDENKGCVLWLLTDVTEKIAVSGGDFKLGINGYTVGVLNVTKTAKLNVFSGTVNGNVTVAKTASLTASVLNFMGTVNDLGNMSSFINCVFVKSLNAKGSNTNLNNCTINGSLNVSGSKVTLTASTVYGKTTVNNGGLLRFMGNGGKYGETLVKSGGGLEVYSNNTVSGKLTAESGSKLTLSGGIYTEIAAKSGAKLTVSGGKFTHITVNGQHLIDCLADGKAFEDMAGGFIIDGRVGIAGGVQVVDHTHTCVWKTSTHEKLCGCGYVEAVDTEAPVISGIADGRTYYGAVEFSVTDGNDFTVLVDGKQITLKNGKYTIEPDNGAHTVTATDVAGNTVTVQVNVYKLYTVTLPTGTGYTVIGAGTAGHGTDYEFEVMIAEGYSKAENYTVLVNGKEPDGALGDERGDKFLVSNVSGNLNITVVGVVDNTPPAVEISIGTNSFKSFLNKITFGLFFKNTLDVTVTASDAGSGVKSVEYFVSENTFTSEKAVDGEWKIIAFENGTASFSLKANESGSIYIRVTDYSGNIRIVNSEGVTVYTDSEAVTEVIDFTMLNNNDVSFEVKLNGNTVSALYNGTSLVDSDNYTVSGGTVTLKNEYLKTLSAGGHTFRAAYNPMGKAYAEGDEPEMTSVYLTVEKAKPVLSISGGSHKKDYDGQPIAAPDYVTSSDGAVTVEYKPAGADDSAYGTAAPKNAGKYEFRISTAETDTYKAASAEGAYEILKKQVSIIGTAVKASKVYDGSAAAEITSAGTLSANYDGSNLKITSGKAAFSDKNAGIKTVSFTGFALSGDAAENYELVSQPESVTAEIIAKELTVKNLKVKDKPYDGKNTAEIDGQPTLSGLVDGDNLQLIPGTPYFGSVKVGKDISVSFKPEFSLFGDSKMLGNYKLTQPSGIKASILEYVAGKDAYTVNSNNWINSDFVVTAANGFELSRNGDPDSGSWSGELRESGETKNGKLKFYIRNTSNGAITSEVSESYKIDKTAPEGTVELNDSPAFKKILSQITFGLFFKDNVNVKLTADDADSGVKSVMYYKSDKALSDAEVRKITDWTEKKELNISAKDKDKFIVYVKITDKAGNVAYIGSDGAIFDTVAPKIEGIEDGAVYYVSQKVTISDTNFKSATLNKSTISAETTLPGNTSAVYTIRAVDKAGNETVYKVTMKPISSVTQPISEVTADNVKSSDRAAVEDVRAKIAGIDSSDASAAEKNELQTVLEKCGGLIKRIDDTAAESERIAKGVNSYDKNKVTSGDKADIEKLISDIDALLGGDNLTADERAALEALRETAKALLDRIADAKSNAEAKEITDVEDITEENVKSGDKDSLEDAKKALEDALRDFDGNYTDDERDDLEKKLETVNDAISAIENAEKAAEEIEKLPDPENVRLKDKDEVERVNGETGKLTENEKTILGEKALEKLNELVRKVAELERISFAPSIIEGAGQSWNESSGKNALFRSNAEFDEFRKVLVDGKELDAANYTVYAGSTAVELKAEYLRTLSAGEHTLSIVSQNGRADTVFTVVRTSGGNSPKTGNTQSPAPWLALLFISGGLATGVSVMRKRKRHSVSK